MTWKAIATVWQLRHLASAYASFRSCTGPPSRTQLRRSATSDTVAPSVVFTARAWLSPSCGSRGGGKGNGHAGRRVVPVAGCAVGADALGAVVAGVVAAVVVARADGGAFPDSGRGRRTTNGRGFSTASVEVTVYGCAARRCGGAEGIADGIVGVRASCASTCVRCLAGTKLRKKRPGGVLPAVSCGRSSTVHCSLSPIGRYWSLGHHAQATPVNTNAPASTAPTRRGGRPDVARHTPRTVLCVVRPSRYTIPATGRKAMSSENRPTPKAAASADAQLASSAV